MDSFCPNHKKFHLSWHSRMINWLVVSNMTCGIWWIFTQSLKSPKISFWWAILFKVYKVWAKKYWGVIFHDTELWCKTWIKPDLLVSKIAWGIGKLSLEHSKSPKNCTLMGSFCPQQIMFHLENFRGICVMTLKGKCKVGLVAWKMT